MENDNNKIQVGDIVTLILPTELSAEVRCVQKRKIYTVSKVKSGYNTKFDYIELDHCDANCKPNTGCRNTGTYEAEFFSGLFKVVTEKLTKEELKRAVSLSSVSVSELDRFLK